jgi:hypothetical protein
MRMTGIGALVGIIFKFTDVLMGNQRVMDTVNVAAETMSIIFSDLINWIVDGINLFSEWSGEIGGIGGMFDKVKGKISDFGGMIKDFIIDSIKDTIKGLGLLGESISLVFQGKFKEAAKTAKEGAKTLWNASPVVKLTKKTIEYAEKVLPVLIDKTKKLIKKGVDYITTTTDQAKAIVKTRNEITKLIGTLEQERVAIQENIDEKTRQRDNEHKTFEERKKATEELLNLESDLLAKDIELAKAKVENAEAELRVNADNLQMQQDLALAQAELEKLRDKETNQIIGKTKEWHELTMAQTASIKELEMLNKFSRERELAEAAEHHKQLLEQARKAGKGEADVTEHYERTKQDIRRKYINMNLQAASGLFGALAGTQEKGSKKWKKMAKAQALINMYLGITKALTDPELTSFARWANVLAVGITGMNNIKAIVKTKMDGSGGEGEGETVSLPMGEGGGFVGDFQEMIPNQLSEQLTDTGTQPVQAYVVETDISDSQALQEELDLQTTL